MKGSSLITQIGCVLINQSGWALEADLRFARKSGPKADILGPPLRARSGSDRCYSISLSARSNTAVRTCMSDFISGADPSPSWFTGGMAPIALLALALLS
jgi:hypothetical protein